MIKAAKNIFLILIVVFSATLKAQQTAVYTNKDKIYKRALDLFEKEKYAAAEAAFDKTAANIKDNNDETKVNAVYYSALCALKLFNRDAAFRLIHFVEQYPESPKARIAYFQLGRYFFRRKKWKKVLQWLDKVDNYNLNSKQIPEFYFKKGYSNFMLKQYDGASKNFYEIKDSSNAYIAAARYYYAYIAYVQGNYQTALENFKKIETDAKFGAIVPYYITQILYRQKKYDKLLAYAPAVLDSATPKMAVEIDRLIGNAYYETKDYKNAVTYLLKYQEKQYYPKREDAYQLGYAYLKSKQYADAEKWFKKVSDKQDSLNQITYYNLGEAYLYNNQKRFAQDAFRTASQMNFDKQIAEDALFNYAKIVYEISYQPYNNAIVAFRQYIKKYPNSPRTQSAYAYLVGVFSTTKNYAAALQALDKIKNKTLKLKETYQKIAYFRAVQLFNDQNYTEAISLFTKSNTYPYDRKIQLNSYYWLAEAKYRMKKYPEAIAAYQQFLFLPEAINSEHFNRVNYNIGYAYFEQKDWANTILWLRKYVAAAPNNLTEKADAMNRIADAYYVTRNLKNAIYYYDQAAMLHKIDVDYSLYKSAIANGVEKNFADKKSLLLTLVKSYKNSPYIDDAYYQLGENALIQNNQTAAMGYFQKVLNNYPNSPYISHAMLKTGLIYYNKNKNDKALSEFKSVVEKYPKTLEANQALDLIKKIYIDKNDINSYEAYVKTVPFVKVSAGALDSASYQIAEKLYFENDCKLAVQHFADYLTKYPNGIFTLKAHYYKADCEFKSNDSTAALKDFEKVLTYPVSKYTAPSLLRAATINFSKKDSSDAQTQFEKLEKMAQQPENIFIAQKALMQIYFGYKKYPQAIIYADTVMKSGKANDNLKEKALSIKANSELTQKQYDAAMTDFDALQNNKDKYAAEAKYNIAFIEYTQGNYDNSEKQIYDLINKLPSYNVWVSKGFILLSDNYVATNDVFRAKQTLKMLIQNTKNDEILKIANQKLDIIKKNEAAKEAAAAAKAKQDSLQMNQQIDSLSTDSNKIKQDSIPNE